MATINYGFSKWIIEELTTLLTDFRKSAFQIDDVEEIHCSLTKNGKNLNVNLICHLNKDIANSKEVYIAVEEAIKKARDLRKKSDDLVQFDFSITTSYEFEQLEQEENNKKDVEKHYIVLTRDKTSVKRQKTNNDTSSKNFKKEKHN